MGPHLGLMIWNSYPERENVTLLNTTYRYVVTKIVTIL
jgi:hypothetical protein